MNIDYAWRSSVEVLVLIRYWQGGKGDSMVTSAIKGVIDFRFRRGKGVCVL